MDGVCADRVVGGSAALASGKERRVNMSPGSPVAVSAATVFYRLLWRFFTQRRPFVA
jgi:hypothetical protein